MIFPEVQDIKTMPLYELHNVIFGSFERKEFKILYKEIEKDILRQEEIMIDDIKDLFDFKVEESEYYFPYVDERKEFNHSFLGYRITPVKGFFWLIKPKIKERMLGLVDVEFSISKISVKENDERFENSQKVYRETKSFYYDYDNQKYIQINKKADNKETDEYKHREKLYSAVLERLEVENLAYLGRLEKYVRYFIQNAPDRVRLFQDYFGFYLEFLDSEVSFLEFKFLLSHIDGENYYQLKAYFSHIKKEVDHWLTELKKLENKGLFEPFNVVQMYEYRYIFEGMNRTRNKICSIFKERDVESIRKNKITTLDGFYHYDRNRLYPNLVYIEVERAFKRAAGSVESREKDEKELLQSLLKNKEMIAAEETKELLTIEQKKRLDQLVGGERITYLNEILNALVIQKVITSSEKVMYLKIYR